MGPEEYLEQLRQIRSTVSVPVIGSLNGQTSGGWLEYAQLMEQAGAQALELNLYLLASDMDVTRAEIETRVLEIVQSVKGSITIPVAVKLSPFFSSLANISRRLDEAGADGLVMFNRFYQPDIDIGALEVAPTLHLSSSEELLLRLRWMAIVSGRVTCSLAVSGGVHTVTDALKAVMAGAHAVQLVSALLTHGPAHLAEVVAGVRQWLVEHEYESLEQAQGSMNLQRSPDPGAYERANYMRILQSWRG